MAGIHNSTAGSETLYSTGWDQFFFLLQRERALSEERVKALARDLKIERADSSQSFPLGHPHFCKTSTSCFFQTAYCLYIYLVCNTNTVTFRWEIFLCIAVNYLTFPKCLTDSVRLVCSLSCIDAYSIWFLRMYYQSFPLNRSAEVLPLLKNYCFHCTEM